MQAAEESQDFENPLFAKYRWIRSSADLVDGPLKIDSTRSLTEQSLGTAPDGLLPQPLDLPTSGAEIRRIALAKLEMLSKEMKDMKG